MNKNFMICLIGLSFLSINLFGSDSSDTNFKIALGVSGGLSQYNSLSGDIYGGIIFPIDSKKAETNFGYTFFQNSTDYRGVKDLKFNSHGLFIEGNYYIIKGFYGGLRFAVNFNWVDKASQKKFDIHPDIDPPTFFSGFGVYGQLGYHLPIGSTIGLKFQGQIGLHNYKISEGMLLINNTGSDLRNLQSGIEKHTQFLHNLNVGMTIRL